MRKITAVILVWIITVCFGSSVPVKADNGAPQLDQSSTVWKVPATWPWRVIMGDGHYYGIDETRLVQLDGGKEQVLADVQNLDWPPSIDPHTYRPGYMAYDNGTIYFGGYVFAPEDTHGRGKGYAVMMSYNVQEGQLKLLYKSYAFLRLDLGDPNYFFNDPQDYPLITYNGQTLYNYVMNAAVPNPVVKGDYIYFARDSKDPYTGAPTDHWEAIVRINKYTGQEEILDVGNGLGVMAEVDSRLTDWYEKGSEILVYPISDSKFLIPDGHFRIYGMDLNGIDKQRLPAENVKPAVPFTPRKLYVDKSIAYFQFWHPKVYNGTFWYLYSDGIFKDTGDGIQKMYDQTQFPDVQGILDWAMSDNEILYADLYNHAFILKTKPASIPATPSNFNRYLTDFDRYHPWDWSQYKPEDYQ
ncbi:hypothetical protein CVV65_05450 [Kyrpidia spormannii]|uniref:DUF5050 domain-containing protein n=1 Tax=Kyrpidia spormannii TaxID=2055160 RepID=A0A2K8N544_9BACL|nr:hypothetical protein [Kyrpidia spormannii]ATY84469.1 hypothetical protein CVV65_05450 [Kyrpidia spormannii]